MPMSKNPEATEVAVSGWWRKKDFGYQAIGAFKTKPGASPA